MSPGERPARQPMGLDASGVLVLLNALSLGELAAVRRDLDRAAAALSELGHADLAELVSAARDSLVAGDLKAFRRAVSTATSRLGHLR